MSVSRSAGPGRGLVERRVRGAWGDPGTVLRAAEALYGFGTDVRNVLWDTGVLRPARAPVPVISVGGLTAGGSAKTPVTAALARALADDGISVAVVTPGEGDELALHREMNPDVPVSGARARLPLARAAAASGASAILLDSGFQHRRLHRDLEIVVMNVDHAGGRARLPAGPYRERFDTLVRADAVVLVTRRPDGASAAAAVAAEVSQAVPRSLLVRARLRPGGLRAANEAARAVGRPDPAVAIAGVMWPEAFFRSLPAEGVRPSREIALPDHGGLEPDEARAIAREAADRGVVCTRKDAVRLLPDLPDGLPVWWLAEEIEWGRGRRRLMAGVHRVATADLA